GKVASRRVCGKRQIDNKLGDSLAQVMRRTPAEKLVGACRIPDKGSHIKISRWHFHHLHFTQRMRGCDTSEFAKSSAATRDEVDRRKRFSLRCHLYETEQTIDDVLDRG